MRVKLQISNYSYFINTILIFDAHFNNLPHLFAIYIYSNENEKIEWKK